ncbi:hypothetical protein, partial [Cronobacter sakazakii]|uniref:hypothetical protein n=1 Tax=Cronobacter sakazakii TaxID=28141 RepID=UPI001F317CFE
RKNCLDFKAASTLYDPVCANDPMVCCSGNHMDFLQIIQIFATLTRTQTQPLSLWKMAAFER